MASIIFPNGFSQQYILMTLIPPTTSFIILTLSSVFLERSLLFKEKSTKYSWKQASVWDLEFLKTKQNKSAWFQVPNLVTLEDDVALYWKNDGNNEEARKHSTTDLSIHQECRNNNVKGCPPSIMDMIYHLQVEKNH